MLDQVIAYLSRDRLAALAGGDALPKRTEGAILLADLSEFTVLGEALARELGQAAGAEELNHRVSCAFADLIEAVHTYGGSVVRFSGDALVCVFYASSADLAGQHAVATAQAMQRAITRHDPLRLHIGVGVGEVCRFLLGDPLRSVHDVLSGAAMENAIAALQSAAGGITIAPDYIPADPAPWPALDLGCLDESDLRPFLLPEVWERLRAGLGAFLSELRLVVPVFIRLDCPESFLNDYVNWVDQVVEQYGGRLSSVEVGDKGSLLIVMFGAPVSTGDDVRRALRCCLALLRDTCGSVRAEALHIGVSQGALYSGTVGSPVRQTYSVYGDEMNVAARLMEAAGAGQVLVSKGVYQAAQNGFVFQQLDPIFLKGKSGPVDVARLVSQLTPSPVDAYQSTPFVGRQKELAQVEDLFRRVWAGQGQIMLVEGEAGVGKSCLVGQIVRRWLDAGYPAYQGEALPEARHTPYFAWRVLLRSFLDLSAPSPDGKVRQLEIILTSIRPDLASRLPLLADILGLDVPDNDLTRHFDAELRHHSTRQLIVDLVRERARHHPLLLILEDAHWLDELAWALVLSVTRSCADLPVFFLLVTRPVDDPLIAQTIQSLPAPTRLLLADLGREAILALAAHRLGVAEIPPIVSDLIVAQGHGNPFYTEELILHLQATGVMRVDGDCLHITGDLAMISLPDTIQGVVQSRLDQLAEPEKLTLKVASAVGRSFEVVVVDESHPAHPRREQLVAQLAALEGADFIDPDMPEPHWSFRFRHFITQEVPYSTLLFAQRRLLHGTIGLALEVLHPTSVELLAYHFSRSGHVGKALHYLRLAAERARQEYANEAAVAYYTQALELVSQDDLAVRYNLLAGREQAHNLQSRRESQRADLEEMTRLAQIMKDDRCEVQVQQRWANYYASIGSGEDAVAHARQALAIAGHIDNLQLKGMSHKELGDALWLSGGMQEAMEHSQKAAEYLKAAGDQQGEAWSLYRIGRIYLHLGDVEKSQEYFNLALELHRSVGNKQGEARCLNELGNASKRRGDYFTYSLDLGKQALALQRAIGDRKGQASSLNDISLIYMELGLYDQGLVGLKETMDIDQETGDYWGIGINRLNIGITCCFKGQLEQALEQIRLGLEVAHTYGHRFIEGFAWQYLGYVHEARQEWPQARVAFQTALDLHNEFDALALCCEDQLGLARLFLTTGDLPQACALTHQVLKCASERDLVSGMEFSTFLPWTAYQVLLACGEKEQALDILGKAYALILERAEKIDDPEYRRAYLEQAVPNRSIVQTWQLFV